jgi:hypothetical protein
MSVLYDWQQPGADGLPDLAVLEARKIALKAHDLETEPDLLTEWCVLVEQLDMQLRHTLYTYNVNEEFDRLFVDDSEIAMGTVLGFPKNPPPPPPCFIGSHDC